MAKEGIHIVLFDSETIALGVRMLRKSMLNNLIPKTLGTKTIVFFFKKNNLASKYRVYLSKWILYFGYLSILISVWPDRFYGYHNAGGKV